MDQINQNNNNNNNEQDITNQQIYDANALLMNNEFYNDDFYDYKDTFLNRSNHKLLNNHNIEIGEIYDEDDFEVGPLTTQFGDEQTNSNGFPGQDFEDQEDLLMMDTFFKRVDSLEMQKPRRAKIINNYLMGELLGDGSYGKVKECLDLNSLSRRAVKIINLKMIARKIPHGVENVRKEINIMRRLNNKNLIKLYDTFEKSGGEQQIVDTQQDPLLAATAQMVNCVDKPPKLYIFMDYCMTSLERLLKNAPDQRLRNWQAQHYFKQLIDGLDYLHSINIIHNDIKPGNLLITCDDILKICDFSISAELNLFYEYEYSMAKQKEQQSFNVQEEQEEETNEYDINPNLLTHVNTSNRSRFPIIQCTPMFQCPEMLDEQIDELAVLKNAPKIDIWSSGVTLFQLTTGELPFSGQTIHQIFENIRSDSNEIKIPQFIDKNLTILLTNLLQKDPLKRWSIKQIKDSEWFKKKHPIVKEDLALLPQDVLQNEFQAFRMITYLEKYCHSQPQQQQQQQIVIDSNTLDGHNLSHNSGCCFNDENSKAEHKDSNSYSDCKAAVSNGQLNKSVSQAAKPATKLKRTHCSLM